MDGKRRLLGKWLLLLICIVVLLAMPATVNGDVGPKPTLKLTLKNLPNAQCYVDLLVPNVTSNDELNGNRLHQNLNDQIQYDQQLLGRLKNYTEPGWHLAITQGTVPPLHGTIVCESIDGKGVMNYSYLGVPDRFKVILVTSDGKLVVSNELTRLGFNSYANFDYNTGKLSEGMPFGAYFLQFLKTCSATLLIEGVVLILFGFSMRRSWKPFLWINALTQFLLTLVVMVSMLAGGIFMVVLFCALFEIVVFVLEAKLFKKYLLEQSEERRVRFSIVANTASLLAWFMIMMI